jgi:uncharacterized protein (DUF924 family)
LERYQEILNFWFGPHAGPQLWFGADESTDREVRKRFSKDLDDAVLGKLAAWEDSPEKTVALVVLLDQFSFQLYRRKRKSYEQSNMAIPIAKKAIGCGFDKRVTPSMRAFLYMPFLHAENPVLQEKSVALFSQLVRECSPEDKKLAQEFLKFAKIHRDVVKKFGRFPGRNHCYGRKNTLEEEKYLKEGGYF